MFKWIRAFKEADRKTQYFALNWLLYTLAIVVTTLYCYARLDFVRSGMPLKKAHEDTRK